MATSIVEPATSMDAAFSSQNLNHLQTNELCQIANAEKAWNRSQSKCNASYNDSLFSLPGVPSSSHNLDYSFSQHGMQKTINSDFQPTDKDGEKGMSYIDQKLSDMKSRHDAFILEMNFGSESFQKKYGIDMSQSSLEAPISSGFDSSKLSQTPMSEKSSDCKWKYSNETCRLSYEKSNSSNEFDTNKPQYSQFPSDSLSSLNYQSNSQIFDFELMKKTYNFGSTNNTVQSEDKNTVKMILPSKNYSDFNDSDLAIKLRSSVHSDFLSKELRNEKSSTPEVPKVESVGALRSVEEILKEYGIPYNTSASLPQLTDSGVNKFATSSQNGLSSIPENSDISSNVNKTANSVSSNKAVSSQEKDGTNIFSSSSNRNMNTLFRNDRTSSSFNLESKNSTTLNTGFTMNVSQNNETTTTSQSSAENELLKKSGSSVDYSSSEKMTAFSRSPSYRSFDYGKATSFSGDNSRKNAYSFSNLGSREFEANIDKIKYEGSQVDSAFSISKSSPHDIIRNMGSLTDTLEYSMSSERQRLRKLDTMISATPFNYSSMELPKSLRPQYLSPERSYSMAKSSDLTGRMYSTSNIPSSSGHGAGISHKNPALRSSGQRDKPVVLNKSISASGKAERNLHAVGRYDTSVDPSTPYWSYGTKDYNFQYNNVYNPQLLDKLAKQKNENKPQKKPVACKKRECSLKNKKDECIYNNNQPSYSQITSGINFLTSGRGDRNIAVPSGKRYAMKPETKKTVGAKKNAGTDINQSKNIGNIYDGFDFVKDLNRMWKEAVFGVGSSAKSNQKQMKYTPYKPTSQEKKEKCNDGHCQREMESNDFIKSLTCKSDYNWDVASSARRYDGYESDVGIKSAHKIRSQSSLEPRRNTQPKSMASASSLVKQASNMSPGLVKKKPTAAPKSILKQPICKAPLGSSSDTNRPHSAAVMSSRSFTQPQYQTPYQLVRGFSPMEFHKTSRTGISTTIKKPATPAKNKPAVRANKTGPRK